MPSPIHRFAKALTEGRVLGKLLEPLPTEVREALEYFASEAKPRLVQKGPLSEGDVAQGVGLFLGEVGRGASLRGVNLLKGAITGGTVRGCNVGAGDVLDGDVRGVNLLVGDMRGGTIEGVNVLLGDLRHGVVKANIVLGDIHGGSLEAHILIGNVLGGDVSTKIHVGEAFSGSIQAEKRYGSTGREENSDSRGR